MADERPIEIIYLSGEEAEATFLPEADLPQLSSVHDQRVSPTPLTTSQSAPDPETLCDFSLAVEHLEIANFASEEDRQKLSGVLSPPPDRDIAATERIDEPRRSGELSPAVDPLDAPADRPLPPTRQHHAKLHAPLAAQDWWDTGGASLVAAATGVLVGLGLYLGISSPQWPAGGTGPGQVAVERSTPAGGSDSAPQTPVAAPINRGRQFSDPIRDDSVAPAPQQARDIRRSREAEISSPRLAPPLDNADSPGESKPHDRVPLAPASIPQLARPTAADADDRGQIPATVSEAPSPDGTATASPPSVATVSPLRPTAADPSHVAAVDPEGSDRLVRAPNNTAPVHAVLAAYENAYERLDARTVKAIWPAVDERALARAFNGLEAQTVTLGTCSVAVADVRATASCTGSATYVTRMGNRTRLTETRRWTFVLGRTLDGWVIEAVETR